MNKCKGCGSIVQTLYKTKEGYIIDDKQLLCDRCFRIRNYNEYKPTLKNNDDYINILKDINKNNDLVVLVADLFSINDISKITKYINNDILLVLTKRDLLPKKINDQKFINYFSKFNIVDAIVISSLKNFNFDLLYKKINDYKKSNNVYVVGFTSSGKSTMINKLIYNYSDLKEEITTSIMPSTTLNSLAVALNENITLIDTPGIIDDNNLINEIDSNLLKKVMPSKEIKPITYQVKGKQFFAIEDFINLEVTNNDINIYISNKLCITRFYKKRENYNYTKEIYIRENEELVISGLGFIRSKNSNKIIVSSKYDIKIYTRRKMF